MSNWKYAIRPVYNSNMGNGYELCRRRWFGYVTVSTEWLRYEKDAFEKITATAKHLQQQSIDVTERPK